jgi:hypothetical protein
MLCVVEKKMEFLGSYDGTKNREGAYMKKDPKIKIKQDKWIKRFLN